MRPPLIENAPKVSNRTKRQDVQAFAYDKRGRLLAVGFNSYVRTHTIQAKYAKRAGKPNAIYLHAELDCLLKARKRGKIHKLVVTRIGAKGFLLAKPCPSCELAIKEFGVKICTHT